VLGHPAYENAGEMLRDASIAMNQAKRQGKSRHVLFRPTMHLRAMARLENESDLRGALERKELQVHYQPILSLLDNRVLGFEALARWAHPKRGFVPPAEFIPVAEASGQIIEIGMWVMHEACRQIMIWQSRFSNSPPLTISVNVSVKQLIHPWYIEQVEQALRATGLDARSLHLEITESIFLENSEVARTVLTKLRAMGIQIFIDDFGIGYSGLGYLNNFPVDAIKIDRSFISQLEYGDPEFGIINSMLRLADELDIKVIAEGIETAKQLSWLRSHRCQYAQGYYFSRPMDPEISDKWLEKTLGVEVHNG
jgi:EAL domain-containing protein (putative c-di-GMP-specific phosphodiesterase class I)